MMSFFPFVTLSPNPPSPIEWVRTLRPRLSKNRKNHKRTWGEKNSKILYFKTFFNIIKTKKNVDNTPVTLSYTILQAQEEKSWRKIRKKPQTLTTGPVPHSDHPVLLPRFFLGFRENGPPLLSMLMPSWGQHRWEATWEGRGGPVTAGCSAASQARSTGADEQSPSQGRWASRSHLAAATPLETKKGEIMKFPECKPIKLK